MKLRISPTISNEYAVRGVFGEGYECGSVPDGDGVHAVSIEVAKAMLEDAEFQIDKHGPFGNESTKEDVPIKLAYAALIKQIRNAMLKARQEEQRLEIDLAQVALNFHPDASPFWDTNEGQERLATAREFNLQAQTTNRERCRVYAEAFRQGEQS